MSAFDNHSVEIKGLTVEHNPVGVAIFGSLDIPRSKEGVEIARQLSKELNEIVENLMAAWRFGNLPEKLDEPKIESVQNPFDSSAK